nr:rep protein [Cressdnaviricota sp.]
MPSMFNNKKYFLTYPQTTANKETYLQWLVAKFPVKEAIVAVEKHADGGDHLHVYVEMQRMYRASAHSFDYENRHPNIQSVRNVFATKTYVKKDGDYIEYPQELPSVVEDIFDVAKESTRREFILYCLQEKVPKWIADEAWLLSHPHSTVVDSEEDLFSRMCPALREFRRNYSDQLSTIIVGEAGCGKTTWAKAFAPKPALWVKHTDTLKAFKPGFHKSIIFDDVSFRHCPRSQQLQLVDQYDEQQIHCRHAVATIPAGVPRIFTCNVGWEPVDLSDAAIARRVKVYKVRELI